MAETPRTTSSHASETTTGVTRSRPSTRRAARSARPGTALTRHTVRTRPSKGVKPLRSLVILAMVGGLIATVALPAYVGTRPSADAQTLQQVAADNAQSLVVASDVTSTDLNRDSYSATTSAEIEKKKAEEAAAERARAEAAAAAASAKAATASSKSSTSSKLSNVNLNMVAPGSGEIRWPLTSFTLGQRVGDRGGAHMGTDMLAPAMTPIFATAAGVVRVSQESYGGYGVGVVIDHVIGGQKVTSIYGHMTYGTRQVQVGQTVEAGQLIGFVGSTGRSTANHLHFEVWINGSVVDSYTWLQANAG